MTRGNYSDAFTTTSNGRMQAGARSLRLRGKVQWRAARAPRCPPVQIPTLAREFKFTLWEFELEHSYLYTARRAHPVQVYYCIHNILAFRVSIPFRPRTGYVYSITIYLWFQGEHSVTSFRQFGWKHFLIHFVWGPQRFLCNHWTEFNLEMLIFFISMIRKTNFWAFLGHYSDFHFF